ncbi:MAG TPA: DUF5916 domain-containing protein [Gemmatimonadales bacterium]
MLLLTALLAIHRPAAGWTDRHLYSGRAGQTAVAPPRLGGDIVIDGELDEPQWSQAAMLTGFSEFTPVDGVAAPDTTQVLVWYSATALYIGIKAIDRTGTVRATLATRDQIAGDDNVQIFLSTFNDGRQATFFAVNPFGVQADGAINENGTTVCGIANCATVTRQQPDLSQDFVWDSKGKLTPDGYQVEIRIPFKSLRFQSAAVQTWGINVLRVVQRSGQEQTWTPVKLGSSSFLSQSGRLDSLSGLAAGHVFDLVPTITSSATGAPPGPGAPWKYQVANPQLGGDLRYGLTPNLTLHATAHPDFSQVESDVTQFSFDPRQAVSYPEKRPFFLDGVEQFDSPSGLIYTRRIEQPVFAGKMTGKVGDNQVGVLAAVDDRTASQYGDNPVFAIMRASHDLGPGSQIGGVWTEQHDGSESNRVIGVDSRVVFNTINSVTVTGAFAHDDVGGTINDAPLWGVGYRRDGRNFRMNYSVSSIADSFVTRSGFLPQTGIADVLLDQSYTWLWHQRTLEALAADVLLKGHYRYDDFINGGAIQNRDLYLNLNARFRGGWTAGVGWYPESFGYDSTIYVDYGLRHPDGTVTKFTGGNARLPNNDYELSGSTPTWKAFDFNVLAVAGLNDENYSEWASGKIGVVIAGMDIRPTDHLRFNLSYNDSRVYRPSDGSRVLLQDVAVGTVEYQLSRAFQLRLITQYSINARDSLRDDSRTDLPIVIRDPVTGVYARAAAYDDRQLQLNFLFTYLPNPGTVIYFGYGTVDQRPDLIGRAILAPLQSNFFVKLSYLWRTKG